MAQRHAKSAMTPEAFGKFLRWLSHNDELAVREYQSIRTKLVRYFVHKGCTDPDELFDKTVDVVVGKIDGCETYPSPLAYCYGVARNIWRQDVRERKPASLDEDIAIPSYADADIHEQELKCLEDCMERLSSTDRHLITQYHQGERRGKIDTRRTLADGVGGANTLRIKMCRIRKDLRLCVADCMSRLSN